ncbi:serine/threonine-protein kinase/endoribonuclease Ire1 isoform X2 [Oratosquilla oratoria]|uniref:serine/threonine-protein kinase/endoribonuclease Ire1 isoform X2 n=1 Tax=Oratosquilla oratoria TaxID=337810 RepID=UPI003F7626B7
MMLKRIFSVPKRCEGHLGRQMSFMICLVLLLVAIPVGVSSSAKHIREQILSTGLLGESDDSVLFVSTLDGALHAVSKSSGTIKWKMQEDPVINVPTDPEEPVLPKFFPNPQDGSLYRYTIGQGQDPLKKLPFTIPQLVSNAPCRSSDGIFYFGKKIDSWVGVDVQTGVKQVVFGTDHIRHMCPKPSKHTVYIGRTHYNIILFDSGNNRKWNISYYDYSTTAAAPIKEYDLVHYTSTGEGSILTVDKKTGSLIWSLNLESPLVAMYLLNYDGALLSVPLTVVAPQTLGHFIEETTENSWHSRHGEDAPLIKLNPTMYVGESKMGTYVLPALVDENTVTISKQRQWLLEGPKGKQGTISPGPKKKKDSDEEKSKSDVIVLGYYNMPESTDTHLTKLSPGEFSEVNDRIRPLGITYENKTKDTVMSSTGVQTDWTENEHFWDGCHQVLSMNTTFLMSRDVLQWMQLGIRMSWAWVFSDILNIFVIFLMFGFAAIIVLLYKQAQEYARLSREMSSRQTWSRGSNKSSGGSSVVTAMAEELDDGSIRVGKIVFDPQELLGKGCDGTFVFRGNFDGRSVAVKRVLPGCFSIADREVDLLRESDQHPNVIRYFCTEQCRQFRYIALELCSATLEDFVMGRFEADISKLTILEQATAGLNHLHSLDIVHRDIKPHNVLLSLPNSQGKVTAMISDFGLCKRLEMGRMSFSKKSGITGTEGWIAPEMMLNTTRPTCKVDIFSLGCVFYYTLTKGKHPFGPVLDRQPNIISGSYDLDGLDSEVNVNERSLVEKMLSGRPSERPPTTAILKHPMFWNPERILNFFQDVSDRVEKESGDSYVMMSLERGALDVVRGEWHLHMHPAVAQDLRKFRDYKGRSVRDLLRAFRNKKNHYRELPESVQIVFGRIPEDYVAYWVKRFPKLLLHAWYAMNCVKAEPIFSKYYDSSYHFVQEYKVENYAFAPSYHKWRLPKPTDDEDATPAWRAVEPMWRRTSPSKGNKSTVQENKASSPVWIVNKPSRTSEPKLAPSTFIKETPLQRLQEDKLDDEDKNISVQQKSVVNVSEENKPEREVPKQWDVETCDSEQDINLTRLQGTSVVEQVPTVATSTDEMKCTSTKDLDLALENPKAGLGTIRDASPVSMDTLSSDREKDMRRDASQLKFRNIKAAPKQNNEESPMQLKVVMGTGKKRRKKHLVM